MTAPIGDKAGRPVMKYIVVDYVVGPTAYRDTGYVLFYLGGAATSDPFSYSFQGSERVLWLTGPYPWREFP